MTDTTEGIFSSRYAPITIANLAVIAIGAFDALAVIATLPSIAEDLGDVALLPWVVTSYLGASAVAVIVAGPVIDAIGVRQTFRVMGIWFVATSVAVSVAPTLPWIVAARTAQGLGGGLMFAVAISVVGIAFPHQLRPAAFAANEAVFATMGVGSPAVAAVLLAASGWRLVFWIQVPLAALALILGWNALPAAAVNRSNRLEHDFAGIALLTSVVGFALFGLAQLGVNWTLAGGSLAVALCLFSVYWRHAGRTTDPVLHKQHLTREPIRWIHLTAGLVLAAGVTIDNYVPLYLQVSRGKSPGFAAFSVVFIAVGWTAGSFVYARGLAHKTEPVVALVGGVWLVPAIGLTAVAIGFEAPLPVVFASMFTMGIGIGLVSTAMLAMIQSASSPDEMGRVNAAHQFLRTLAISLGVALGGAILLSTVDARVGDVEVVRSVLAGDSVEALTGTRDAVAEGMVWILVASGVLASACVAGALGLRRSYTRQSD